MKLILTQDVAGLGAPATWSTSKDGYGRNYLLPAASATPWTKGGEKQVAQIERAREVREVRDIDQATAVKKSLEGLEGHPQGAHRRHRPPVRRDHRLRRRRGHLGRRRPGRRQAQGHDRLPDQDRRLAQGRGARATEALASVTVDVVSA
jgi:hypothetical protein